MAGRVVHDAAVGLCCASEPGDAAGTRHRCLPRVDALPTDPEVVVYFETDDLDEQVHKLEAAGFGFFRPPTDQRWLRREARPRAKLAVERRVAPFA
jgi:hypothetical protein